MTRSIPARSAESLVNRLASLGITNFIVTPVKVKSLRRRGHRKKQKKPYYHLTKTEHRDLIKSALNRRFESNMDVHAVGLARQGGWTKWSNCNPFNMSWNTLVNSRAPKLITFILNSFSNQVKCPSLMKLWGYWTNDH